MSLGNSIKEEVKKAVLDLLEEDREFRYALMGLLGFREVLDRISRIEERQQKLEERFARLEERVVKLEERFARLEERFAELEERFAKLEERQQKLEERQQKLEERFLRVEEELRDLRRVVVVVGHRFGVISEAGLREALKYVVEDILGAARVERITLLDEEGIVYGHPAEVEVDIAVRDNEHILIEVKSRASRMDVAELARIGVLYEKKTGRKPKLLLVAGFIDNRAYETAAKLGVILKPAIREEKYY